MEIGFPEEIRKGEFPLDTIGDLLFIKPGQPGYDLVQFLLSASLSFHLGHVMRVDGGKSHVGNPFVVFVGDLHGLFFGYGIAMPGLKE